MWFASRILVYSPINVPFPTVTPAIATKCAPREITTSSPNSMTSVSLRFQMHSRVEEHIFTDANVTASVDPDPPQYDDGGG